MDDTVDFVDWVLIEMESKNISQADIARAGGITRSAISKVLTRTQKRAGIDVIYAISKALDKPIGEVVRRALGFKVRSHTEKVEDMVNKIDSLPQEDQEIIDAFIQTMLERRRGKTPENTQPANNYLK